MEAWVLSFCSGVWTSDIMRCYAPINILARCESWCFNQLHWKVDIVFKFGLTVRLQIRTAFITCDKLGSV